MTGGRARFVESDLSGAGWDAAALLALVAALGLPGGTPYFPTDFIVTYGLKAMANYGDPDFFAYPALMLYLHGLLYAAIYAALLVTGEVAGTADFEAMFRAGEITFAGRAVDFYLPGQVLTLAFSALGVAAAYYVARRLSGSRACGLAAGALLATAPLWVEHGHYVTVDAPLAALVLVTMAACLTPDFDEWRPPRRALLLVALAFGATISVKYTGAVVFLSIAAFLLLHHGRLGPAVRDAFVVGVGATLLFLLVNPYIVINSVRFLDAESGGFAFIMTKAFVTGHYGATAERPLAFYLAAFRRELSDLFLALAAVGAVGLLADRGVEASRKALLFVFPVVLALILARAQMTFIRYALPLVPILAVLAGLGLWYLARLVAGLLGRGYGTAAALALAALTIGPNLAQSAGADWVLAQPDTREALKRAAKASGLDFDGLSVFAGAYTKEEIFSPERIEREGGLWRTVLEPEYDIVVLDRDSHQRFIDYWETRPFDPPFADLGERSLVRIAPSTGEAPPDWLAWLIPAEAQGRRQGPLIELYFRDPARAERFAAACAETRGRCEAMPGAQGHFATAAAPLLAASAPPSR